MISSVSFTSAVLGVLSFLLNRVVGTIMRCLTSAHAWRRMHHRNWRVFSQSMLDQPLVMPAILTSAPRWNPHAVIAMAGPVHITEQLRFDESIANACCPSWSLSLYSFPGHKLVRDCGTHCQESTGLLKVPKGNYMIAWRYQDPQAACELPMLEVDNQPRIDALSVPAGINSFYQSLASRNRTFYVWLNYYVFVMLRCRQWFPASWLEREFVPVGSGDTQFHFGAICRGQHLQIAVPDEVMSDCAVSLTVYNTASLPTYWTRIESSSLTTSPVTSDGYYLMRIRFRFAETGLHRVKPHSSVSIVAKG